jgi:hypothetical protein
MGRTNREGTGRDRRIGIHRGQEDARIINAAQHRDAAANRRSAVSSELEVTHAPLAADRWNRLLDKAYV